MTNLKIGDPVLVWDKNGNDLTIGDFLMTYSTKGKPVLFRLMPIVKEDVPNNCKVCEVYQVYKVGAGLIRGDNRIIIPTYWAGTLEMTTKEGFNAILREWQLNQLSPHRKKHLKLKAALEKNPTYSELKKIKKALGVR
jgi:hypothetical protein